MEENKKYTTIGAVYDYLVEKHRETGRDFSFPEAVAALDREGRLLHSPPPLPPFHSGMDMEAFLSYIRRMPIDADPIIPQEHTFMFDPSVEEVVLFPDDKDVFCIFNMPHMVTLAHTHNFFELTYVLKGSCALLFEGESVTLSAGDLCIVSPGSRHSLPLEPGCIALSLVVRRSTFDSVFGNLLTQTDLISLFFRNSLYESRRANYLLLKTGNDLMTFHTIQQLACESNSADDYANNCAISLLNLFLARAMRSATSAATLYHYEGYSERTFDFSLVLQYIQQNYRTVTLSSLAKTFHFSEAYLSKLIRKNLNQSYTDILRTLRLNRAVEYLINTSMKISEIADAVGYDSVDHFTRTFRHIYGMPPTEYRQSKRLKQQAAT